MPDLGLVVSEFNREITREMEERAEEHAGSLGAEVVEKVHVPGAYDSPLAAKRLCELDEVDAVVVLGVVIEGETDHDEVVVESAASKLTDVAVEHDKPVTLGISGPGMTRAQAYERVVYAERAVESAVEMVDALGDIG
ncbi:MAG: 6,7-dimethyl-8-ribityllumazine synthase [Halobacteria archaeon]|nr:6,7-dimethyl-8-ribityllumazine synthase [Halobacteria archaeon]